MPKVTFTSGKGLVQETGSADFNLSGEGVLFGHKSRVETLATATTLTAADSGKVFLLVQAGADRTATLPAAASGLHFNFILKTAAANNWDIVQAAAAQDFVGTIVDGAVSIDTATTTDTKVTFVGGTAVAGDQIECWSDGDDWYIRGTSDAAGGIIFA